MTNAPPDALRKDPAASAAIRTELLEASDAEIEAALEHADPMVLRGLVYQLTGDAEIAATEVIVGTARGFAGGIEATPEAAALIRRKAADFLEYRRKHFVGNALAVDEHTVTIENDEVEGFAQSGRPGRIFFRDRRRQRDHR